MRDLYIGVFCMYVICTRETYLLSCRSQNVHEPKVSMRVRNRSYTYKKKDKAKLASYSLCYQNESPYFDLWTIPKQGVISETKSTQKTSNPSPTAIHEQQSQPTTQEQNRARKVSVCIRHRTMLRRQWPPRDARVRVSAMHTHKEGRSNASPQLTQAREWSPPYKISRVPPRISSPSLYACRAPLHSRSPSQSKVSLLSERQRIAGLWRGGWRAPEFFAPLALTSPSNVCK